MVTGAAQGIGAGIAAALRAEGAVVTGIDRQAMPDGGIVCDLARGDEIAGAVAEAVRRMGRIDILVNNAGINERRGLGEIDAGHLDRMIAVNLRAPILVAQAALPHMGEGGRIVNVASELAYLGRAGGSVYAATKAGLIALTRSWARELVPAHSRQRHCARAHGHPAPRLRPPAAGAPGGGDGEPDGPHRHSGGGRGHLRLPLRSGRGLLHRTVPRPERRHRDDLRRRRDPCRAPCPSP